MYLKQLFFTLVIFTGSFVSKSLNFGLSSSLLFLIFSFFQVIILLNCQFFVLSTLLFSSLYFFYEFLLFFIFYSFRLVFVDILPFLPDVFSFVFFFYHFTSLLYLSLPTPIFLTSIHLAIYFFFLSVYILRISTNSIKVN